ncbi:prepilin-type N-terminal cleavage/methylation domain-containing protein [Methylobacterium currus]|uniref:GspH/FimT family pseudopilin n=1 Tax=Methylobacterium currus TaxID=2051553 RepID=UPI001E643F00|nr:GspH/FimT family pseudopilin [Methylobacterium currus]UHC17856.1 prepilin-type N-terminal cleavage/methylation domain-containing protein [Methylobacterium currus]
MTRERPTSRAISHASSGFTLIEMLVVLAILAVSAAVVPLAVGPVRERTLLARSSAALADLIARAHAAAIREGHTTRLDVDLEHRTVVLAGTSQRIRLDPSLDVFLTTAQEVGRDGRRSLLFLPDGTATGGRFRLSIAGGRAPGRSLSMSWLTGAVSRER